MERESSYWSSQGSRLNRRRMLGTAAMAGVAAAFLAACGGGSDKKESTSAQPAAGSAPAPSGGAAQQPATNPEWENVVAAAKREGKVVINVFPGDGYARALAGFSRAYPDIKLEITNLHSQDFAPRILQERKAGQFTWDVANIPTTTALQVLKPEGVWDPIRPAIILPELKDEKTWNGGYEAGYLDKTKDLCFAFTLNRSTGLFVDTNQVKPAEEPKSIRDLADPKWKGKLLLADVRTMGDAFWPMTIARLAVGDDIVKQLFVDQEPVLSRDTRQMTEFMVRGRYPISMGANQLILNDFLKQGLGKNLKNVKVKELDYQSSGNLWLINRAPHPNAAKVLINWILTKDAQIAWAKELETNSRRVDVEPGNPDQVVPVGLKLPQIDQEDMLAEIVKTQDIGKALIK